MVRHAFVDVEGDGNCWYRCLAESFKQDSELCKLCQSSDLPPHDALRGFVANLAHRTEDGHDKLNSTLQFLHCAPFVETEIPFVENVVTELTSDPEHKEKVLTAADVMLLLSESIAVSGTYSSQVETDLMASYLKDHSISLISLNAYSCRQLEHNKSSVVETKLYNYLTGQDVLLQDRCIVLVRIDNIAHYVYMSLGEQHIIDVTSLVDYLQEYLTEQSDREVNTDSDSDSDSDSVESADRKSDSEIQSRYLVIDELAAICRLE